MRGFGRGTGAFGRRWVELYLLLLIAEKPSHGYELSTRLKDFGVMIPGIGQMGSLYRILSTLEMSGLVATDWDISEGGPARKVYKITKEGLSFLEDAMESVYALKTNIEKFIERYEALKKRE
ncbi:MAG: PadR family transcriptional regulator [Thermotogae bacterium]|uniref:PadR family transcriptional regulator n=1 Tax=Kosmotoga sp. TaxID=1955248 RepID=UPI000F28F218|nr:PadR family transcriptional regulator [Kosmotoga sp.]MBO8167408.1 PadR family transcriptional regulator [Kosmotoga sp.]RKX50554.1 MAG: PadR family transcriptional regulator [Thermotogota bacterium]